MSISEELRQLSELHQRGVLSDDEFTRAKARVVNDPPPSRTHPALAAVNGLRRSRSDRWFGGVCGGLAQITGLAAWMWRVIFALLVVCGGTGVLVYLLLWIFLPQEPAPFHGHTHQRHAS